MRLPLLALAAAFVPVLASQQFVQTARQTFPLDDLATTQVSLVDLDGDGDLDVIATSSSYDHFVRVYWNDGHGHFVADPRFQPIDLMTNHVIGDFDGDGDQDVM